MAIADTVQADLLFQLFRQVARKRTLGGFCHPPEISISIKQREGPALQCQIHGCGVSRITYGLSNLGGETTALF